MKIETSPVPVSEYRVRARRLLNSLRSNSAAAAARFRRLRSFADDTEARILESRDQVKLKHALAVVALEAGYDSWRSAKEAAEATTWNVGSARAAPGREMYDPGMDVLLNRWFARYGDARDSLEEQGGFLFPFDRQFFVCEEEGVRLLGMEAADPDWDRIGRDWVKPADRQAWLRLKKKRELVLALSDGS
jgi:hypothetical protein